MEHPLFLRPWRELSPLFWGSYVLGPPLVDVLATPIGEIADPMNLLKCAVSVGLALGIIHAIYRLVIPRLIKKRPRGALVIAAHLMVLLIGVAIGAELTHLFPPAIIAPYGGPGTFRIHFYRFGVVYGGALITAIVAYDRMKDLAERETRIAQLEALQIRTNPHFLFNALNTIACLIAIDPKRATESIEKMSDLFRFMLEFTHEPAIPLQTELDVVRKYLEIEALRYDGLRYELDVDPSVQGVLVPPLIVQPLMENAVKHGIARTEVERTIHLRAFGEERALRVEITNSSAGPSDVSGSGKSLEIVRQRLQLAYGDRAQVQHGPINDRYRSTIQIPMEHG